MKYTDLSINLGFHKNMQETHWLKLFPKWWSENDPLLQAIGKEIAYIKADGIFQLLNVTVKPPVMIWQESINHKKYTESFTIEKEKKDEETLYELVKLPAPLYKTYGTITLKNNSINDVTNLKIALNETDYIIILDTIATNDIVVINVGLQKVYINKKEANILINGEGLSYFKTGQNKQKYIPKIVYNKIDDEIISYTVTVPVDFDGKIRIVNSNKTELYDDFFDEENIVNNDDNKERTFYIANTDINKKNLYIKLYDSELYLDVKLKTSKKKIEHQMPKPLHNESVNLLFNYNNINSINMDVDIVFDNAVFVNEQNIEVHGLELIPIKSVNLYAYYDFPYNSAFNGWRKVYEKEYDPNTIVLYDMITTHFYTKQFYVEVFFENLDYPYVVGFPCEKDADKDSIYHINENLDAWGEYFGLKRREYKTNIPEEDYPFTFPQFYPFDIEQDYWYYQRLINEYAWNDLAINQVDLLDTNNNPIVRLHSIDPFVQDFVVYANSTYPKEKENIDYNIFMPNYVNQDIVESEYKRMPYYDTQNLLRYDNNTSHVTLLNKNDINITTQRYLSKPLRLFFDLKDLPPDIDIDDVIILVEAESTDNNIDKYSNAETGIIIPSIDENKVYKMIQSENYELEEKEIEYNLSDTIKKIKDDIHQYDKNIIHQAIIKPFKAKQGTYLKIPFILKENNEIIDNITEVYVTYDDIKTYQGEYHSDKNGRYITVWLPVTSRNYKTMSISCKSNVNNSFIAKDILLSTVIEEETIDDNTIGYTYIYGPIVDEQQQTIYIDDEWHTADLRDILQKDGIFFINTFENDNTKNTPTILLKNIRLKVRHRPKKSTFKLETQIIKKNVQAPSIAQLQIKITNTGGIPLQTKIDIVHATNLKIQPFTCIDVDLGIDESSTTILDIIPEYPILDGQYDILTVCEDKKSYNTITLSANGLIQTGVILKEHYGKYNDTITLQAEVTNVNNFIIDDGASKILFFIDDFKVGEGIVQNNKVSINIEPSASKYLDAGIHMLEARFSGNDKFASSRTRTSLLISQNNTILDLTADDIVIYGQQYRIKTDVYLLNDNEKILINEGNVSFYVDNEKIGTIEVINGEAQLSHTMNYIPQNHIITAIYNGTLTYAKVENSKIINIIGGETTTTVFDVSAKPTDTITLKAKIKNVLNTPITNGTVIFKIMDNNTLIYQSNNIDVNYGIASTEYTINNNVLDDTNIKEYDIIAEYTDSTETYQNSQGKGSLVIEKGQIVINNLNVFFGSQYEPLGFYLDIKDAKTNEPVTDGQIMISIPDLNIITPLNNIDEDGGVRIIHNPTTITADEFEQLLDFYFKLGKTMPYKNDNNEIIPLLLDNDISINSFKNTHLYRIYNGELSDLNLMDFRLGNVNNGENPNSLYYQLNSDSNADEQIYIGEDGHLYARTNIDPLRTYPKDGTFPINIDYISDIKYQNNNKQSLIRLNRSAIDVDIHSQHITYGEQEKSIICYVTEYNLGADQTTILVDEGNIIFFIDDQEVHTSEVVNGLGVMSSKDILDVQYGKHLLMAEYISENKPTTYTYADLYINPITSGIIPTFNRKFKGQKSKLTVQIYINDNFDVPITGDVEVYLDDTLIGSIYLFGTEDLSGNVSFDNNSESHLSSVFLDFIVNIPDDIDILEHTLTIKYSGDEHILPCTEEVILREEKLPISIETSKVYVAQNEICHLELDIQGEDGGFINDGEILVYQGSDNLKAKGYVKNNHVDVEWLITDEPSDDPYLYTIVYENSEHYQSPDSPIIQNIYVIEAKDDVYIAQDEDNEEIPYEYDLPILKTLQQALQCVKDDGNIHIIDYVDIKENITINKNVNIIGANNAYISKDLPNLLTDEIGAIQIYDYIDFEEEIYEIVGLTKEHLNTVNFHVIDTDLYFVDKNDLIPIFLLSDNKFYSYKSLSLSAIISNVSLTFNGQNNISNLHFTSADTDNNNDFIIKIQNQVNIQKCIFDETVTINNQSYLQLNTSLVYCDIVGSQSYDLNNNWWGSNQKPAYNIDSWIILGLDSNTDPPVIGDNIQIIAKLISTNGFSYDLPSLNYYFEANSGYFSIENGQFVENTIRTTYIDGAEECTIKCTVDNETLSLDILSYDRKTEVILEPVIDIPIGEQIPITAKVQSVADTYYKFNDNLEIIEQSNNINNGYIDFYVDNIKIGRSRVINGQAELPVYFSEQEYPIINNDVDQYVLPLKAIYIPTEYYFKSESNKKIQLIDGSKVCFVSPTAKEGGDGTFYNPYDSIQIAVSTDKKRVYLKDGVYSDSIIKTNGRKEIIRYSGECIFKDIEENIFYYNSSSKIPSIYLKGLTFISNKGPYIVRAYTDVTIEECIFYKNECYSSIIRNREQYTTTIINSVFVDNRTDKKILYRPNEEHTITKCWFGTNDPNTKCKYLLGNGQTFNDYILMSFTSSKNKIYLGSVTHLKASLDHYYHNGEKILLEEPLPLRIAKFSTEHGLLMPLKDYTYNNESITFLDTNKKSNTDKIILTAHTNNNYITKPLTLKCDVKNIYDEPINKGQVKFKFTHNSDVILFGDIIDGCATVEYPFPLNPGEYQLICSYDKYSNISTFKVLKPKIIISNCNISSDCIYDMSLDVQITDSFNKEHINQDINIFIDDIFIAKESIINNRLTTHLTYDFIEAGSHTLTITTENLNSDYSIFTYNKNFIASKKDTNIVFNYSGLTVNEPTDLIIKVYDKDGRPVKDGYITIKYDNETVYVTKNLIYSKTETEYNNIVLENGFCTIKKFYSTEGQHSFVIYYSGNNTTYNDCLYTNNNFNVGLNEVIIQSQELKDQLSVNIGQPFLLHFPITDIHNNLIQRGEVNLFLDNFGTIINESPLQIKNGYVDFEGSLPVNTKAMTYDFIITYNDPLNNYIPTTYYDQIIVHSIKTEILVDTIYTEPNTTTDINYSIESEYGSVMVGQIKAYYEDNLIGQGDVSDTNSTITLNIPMLSAEETYHIRFEYNDTNQKTYSNSQKDTPMIITKSAVNITVPYVEYYPHKNFNYNIGIKDNNNNNITFGTIKLYIDNIEVATKQVVNGNATIPLSFDTVKDYNFNIVYLENDYYSKTEQSINFSISNISLQDISLETMHSIPNNILETKLNIQAIDISTYDGFIDFYIDDNKIGAFSVVDKENQYVKLNIPNIDAGTHQMKFIFYNSSIFKDDEFIHNFVIDTQTIHLTVPSSYTATLNDVISFDATIAENIMGTLEYYLISTENNVSNSRFIGIEQINNRNTIPFTYTLPNDLTQNSNTKYYISVNFTGNNQYVAQEKRFRLNINKQLPDFEIFNVSPSVEYRSEIQSTLQIGNISNQTIVYFCLDTEDNIIGHKRTDDVDEIGYIEFNYKLTNDYKPGETHSLIALIKESTTLESATISENFVITKATPSLDKLLLEANIGTNITLPTTVIDKGHIIDTGTLTFILDNNTIGTVSAGEILTYTIDTNYEEEKQITVQYVADPNSDYNNFEDTILLQLNKNVINFDISDKSPITRNTTINRDIIISSPTISNIENINYHIYLEDEEIESLLNFNIPIDLPDKEYYILRIVFDGNDMFYERIQEFKLINQNQTIINTDEIDLKTAFDLVADHGTIDITSYISDEEIDNNKNVTIVGNHHIISNCNIYNTGVLSIQDLVFENSEDSVIKNDGELYVHNCTFRNNHAQYGAAIYVNNKNINTEIIGCTFTNNVAELYGGAIFSNQGNDVTIQSCVFSDNNNATVKGSSISSNGNMYISQNIFYDNIGDCEIYVISNTLEAEENYFDGKIKSIKNKGIAICDLNYWGYNDQEDILTNNIGIDINTWFVSGYDIDYKEPALGDIHKIITPIINQYRNTLEKENLIYKNIIEVNDLIPITIAEHPNETYYLNQEIDLSDSTITLIIGQEEFIIGD